MKPQGIIHNALQEQRTNLTEWEASKILSYYGIPVAPSQVANNIEEGLQFAEELGYPLVLKILSPHILHKSDEGGVVINITHKDGFKEAWKQIEKRTKGLPARIDGMLVQKMANSGLEVIIGVLRDTGFGPVLLFGLGGIFVEVFDDVSLRLIPIQKVDALEMIEEIKAYPLLKGARGREPIDTNFLMETLLKVSQMMVELPLIKELDMNPFFLYPKGGIAVDALITLYDDGNKGA